MLINKTKGYDYIGRSLEGTKVEVEYNLSAVVGLVLNLVELRLEAIAKSVLIADSSNCGV